MGVIASATGIGSGGELCHFRYQLNLIVTLNFTKIVTFTHYVLSGGIF